MPSWLRAQYFSIKSSEVNLLVHVLCLATSIMACSVLDYTIASSIFLMKVGVENIPLAFIIFGLVSIPIYAIFFQVVENFSCQLVLRYLLLVYILLVLILRALVNTYNPVVFYAIYIASYFQCILLLDIVFPSLVSDYFTTLDWKRYTAFLSMAMAIGALLGGGLAMLLAIYLKTENMLMSLPIFYGIAIAQSFYLERSHKNLNSTKQEAKTSLILTLKTFPPLVNRYPLIIFLATKTLLFVILYSIAEFLYLRIYSQAFPNDQALTSFLGMLRVTFSVLQLLVAYFFTRLMVVRWGVSSMNLVYGITTLASFIVLAVNFNLPIAIVANINSNALYKGIEQPISNLNYNAIPHRFVGQVRAITEGLFYSLGLALAGVLLWYFQQVFTLSQITFIGIALSLLFLGLRYLQGKKYYQSLVTVLQDDVINLDNAGKQALQMAAKSNDEVRQLLNSDQPDAQLLGIELVGRSSNPSLFLEEVQPYLKSSRPEVINAAVATIGQIRTRKAEDILFKYLQPHYHLLAQTLEWQQQIPGNDCNWQPLLVALEDYHQRLLRRVLQVLSELGDRSVVNCVQQILHSRDQRQRANAVETLASFKQRRFVQPILPLLERTAKTPTPQLQQLTQQINDRKLLHQAWHSGEHWIRIGALLNAVQNQPLRQDLVSLIAEASTDNDPLVRACVGVRKLQDNFVMNRLLFLKTTHLLKNLTLDELLIVDNALRQVEFKAGEIICTEDSFAKHFYIIYQGSIRVLKKTGERQQQLARLTCGQHFGEMELFEDSPLSITAVADTNCTLLTLENNRFHSLLIQCPEIMLEISKVLSRDLREANERLKNLSHFMHIALDHEWFNF